MDKRILTHKDCVLAATRIRDELLDSPGTERRLYGVPRGGIPAVYLVAGLTPGAQVVEDPSQANFIIDDIVDSGTTAERYMGAYPQAQFLSLFPPSEQWLVFPWEVGLDGNDESATDIPTRLLQYIGEDPEREGLKDTPKRFLNAWKEYTTGYMAGESDIEELLRCFKDGAERVDELVLVRDIPVYSHCEHHLAPFFGTAHVAYIPDGKVLGLSKFARLVDVFAKRLQVQERMTQQIAHAINTALNPKGVGVVLECRHLCMEQRGIRARGASTTTSCLLGALKADASARAEFMRLVR